MAAIGDSEGTVTVMQLSKALYETTSKEKEIMGQIFDREFRREKNLLTQKKLNKDAGSKVKKADKKGDPGAKESEQKEKITKIEEEFFNIVSKDDDLAAIKARGQMVQQQEESAAQD